MSEPIVFLNGAFVARSQASVSPDDRAFYFGDGAYEVVRFYDGRPFAMDQHLARLERSLATIKISGVDSRAVEDVLIRLVEVNDLVEALAYVQVSRGVAPRQHAFPPRGTPPSIYGFAQECRPPESLWRQGSKVITVPDLRWGRCDVKSLNLLPNVLANQSAVEAGVDEAILTRDGFVTEGSHSNVLAVIDGTLVTHPADTRILGGVTRAIVLELCRELGLPLEQRPIGVDELPLATEVMILSTRDEVMPVVEIDGRPVGEGRPGPVAGRLLRAFRARTRPARAAAARSAG